MRNLVEYPITADEAIAVIRLAEEKNQMDNVDVIGCIDGVALLMIEKFIEQNKDRFDVFSKASFDVIFEGKL